MKMPDNLMEFWSPDPGSPLMQNFRPTFCMPYSCPKAVLKKANKPMRLGDLIICVIDRDDPEYLTLTPEKGQFVVFDHRTGQKGFIEIPKDAKTPAYLTSLVEAHFGTQSLRITPTLWVV